MTKVGEMQINNVNDFETAMNKYKGHAVGMTVKDDKGDSRYIAMKVPKD